MVYEIDLHEEFQFCSGRIFLRQREICLSFVKIRRKLLLLFFIYRRTNYFLPKNNNFICELNNYLYIKCYLKNIVC